MSYSKKHIDRRSFLKGLLRTILLGSIAVVCGLLGLRRSGIPSNTAACVIELPCAHCDKRSGCTDPKALASVKNDQYPEY